MSSTATDGSTLPGKRPYSRTMGEQLQKAADLWGDQTALMYGSDTWTFEDLHREARVLLGVFHSLGMVAGDRVLVMLPNIPTHLQVLHASGAGGLVVVPVNTEYRGEMLRYIITSSQAKTLVVGAEYLARFDKLEGLLDELGTVLVVGNGDFISGSSDSDRGLRDLGQLTSSARPVESFPTVLESDPIGVMYTSGTTGPSKGALIAHRHAFEYSRSAGSLIELRADDVYYAPLPLFHIAGQWAVAYAALQSGACVYLKKRFSVGDFWSDVADGHVTTSFLLGAMAQWLHGQPPTPGDSDNSLDRVLMVPLIDEVAEFAHRHDVRVSTCYGSTESNLPIAAGFGIDNPASCGRECDGYETRLVDENDEEVPAGEVGELVVRTEEPFMTVIEYDGRPEATVAAFRNLWLHTGDLMRQDEGGNYYFVDRSTDSLRRRGENISSFEVEREAYAHPAILECAAIAIPSDHTEDDLGLVVVFREGESTTEDELRQFLRDRMPKFMVPDTIIISHEMPKTPTGKIQKHILRAHAAEAAG